MLVPNRHQGGRKGNNMTTDHKTTNTRGQRQMTRGQRQMTAAEGKVTDDNPADDHSR